MIVEAIDKYLRTEGKEFNEYLKHDIEKIAGWTFQRQFIDDRETKKGVLRLSSAGRCARQQAYAFWGYERNGREIDTRAKLTFWIGDLIELTVVSLMRQAGIKVMATGFNQLTVKFDVDGIEVLGHPDGIVHHNGEFYLLEVKSMSSYGYQRFEKGDIDAAYLTQANAYMEALNLDKAVFVVINKDNAVMAEQKVNKDPSYVAAARLNLGTVLASSKDNLPQRAHKPDEKGYLPWQCQYCAYWKTCWPDAKEVLVSKRKKLKVGSGNAAQQ